MGNNELQAKILRLQAENEELKEINLQLQTIDMEIDRNNKFRKALQEIREISTNAFNLEDDDGGYLYQKILDKINEVLK